MNDLSHPYELPLELDGGFEPAFRRLERIFRARGVPRDEAADMAQESFARALVHLKRRGCTDGTIAPLLSTIAANLVIDRARGAHRRPVSIDGMDDFDEPAIDLSEEFERRQVRAEVLRALGTLSGRHQHALALALDGHSPSEIAEMLGIQRNAADALLHRARKRLADALRAGSVALHGVIVLTAFRLRSLARRAGIAGQGSDGMFAAGSVSAVNIVTVVIATIVALSGMPTTGDHPAQPPAVEQVAADTAPVEVEPETTGSEPDGARAKAVQAGIDPKARTVHAGTTWRDPTGREHRAGVLIWKEEGGDAPEVRTIDVTCLLTTEKCR